MDSETTAGDDVGMPRPIGAILGAARRALGIELTDIARDTRVPVRHLAAIEADDHDHLPALPYAIGFVKAFARAVGVDPEAAGAHFRAETSKAAHVPVAPAMTPLDERRLPPRGVVTASVVALLAVVALIVAWSAGAFDSAPPVMVARIAPVTGPALATGPAASDAAATANAGASSASAPPTTAPPPVTAVPGPAGTVSAPVPVKPAPVTNSPVATSPTTTIASLPGAALPIAGSVAITATQDAWFKVSVYDPGAAKVVTVKTGVLAKGERYVPPSTPGLRLWTGRAGALTITVDGRALPPLGGPVETVKNVSLDPADLRARLAGPSPAMVKSSGGHGK